MAILGIDLGTTNSLGAVYRNGNVELIPNRFGSFLTPSVVSVTEDGSVLTGQIAKERLITHPKDTASSFKKDMGTDRQYLLGGKSSCRKSYRDLLLVRSWKMQKHISEKKSKMWSFRFRRIFMINNAWQPNGPVRWLG